MTGATLFSGFGGADIGMESAGVDVLWGIELVDEIAQVARDNALNTHTGDITEADPADYPKVDCLHASPVCKSFSVAKAIKEELEIDREAAKATVRFLEHIQPKVFTLENVWGYRGSESWQIIYSALRRLDYGVGFAKLCAADYGVPQTRERMIVWAIKGRLISGPTPTHAENPPEPGFFGDTLPKWIGWYEAIEDLIPTLPETELAPWQLHRLPEDLRTLLCQDNSGLPTWRDEDDPACTVTSQSGGNVNRAVLVHATDMRTMPVVSGGEPAFTSMSSNTNMARAVLVDGKLGSHSTEMTTRNGEAPGFTVTTSHSNRDVKGILVAPDANGSLDGHSRIDREEKEPATTIRTGTSHVPRAVLLSGDSIDGGAIASREADQPAITAKTNGSRMRAAVGVRVVQMTPRCLARFQSFPDTYKLPEKRGLACTGIGNAVPPLLQQRVYENVLDRIAPGKP